MRHLALIAILVGIGTTGRSAEAPADPASFAGKQEMNGFRLSDFKDFEKNWHFVTVRFRKDTNEMRFTYANDSAWAALQQRAKEYPKGAVFAKIGIATKDDPSFASSAVPSGARRTQFMVRDKDKFKETDGWGYALFDANGVTFPEDPHQTSVACAACHRLVPERGYVFSEPMAQSSFTIKPTLLSTAPAVFAFSDVKTSELPAELRALVSGSKARSLQGDLRRSLFQGTLDEIRPVLADETSRTGLPALLISEDGKRYSVVSTEPKGTCADSNLIPMKGVSNIYFKGNETYEVKFCHPKRK